MRSNVLEPAQALLTSMPEFLLVLFAWAFIATGTLCLWLNWQKKQSNLWLKLTAWCLIVIATPFWVAAYGIEFGLTFELIALALIAWLYIAVHYESKPIKTLPRNQVAGISQTNKLMVTAQVFAIALICPVVSLWVNTTFWGYYPRPFS